MAGSGKGISGTGIAALFGGSLLLWSAIKGRKWSEALREVIAGKPPSSTTDYPISGGDSGAAASLGGAAAEAGAGAIGGMEKARASSFWGAQTASGRPMDSQTIASPYLPLGTQITVEYKGKTVSGTVWDLGPADWVMAADPSRFLDLAEPMMEALTGTKSTVIPVNYKVTTYGNGRIYRPNHPMTKKLRKRWTGR